MEHTRRLQVLQTLLPMSDFPGLVRTSIALMGFDLFCKFAVFRAPKWRYDGKPDLPADSLFRGMGIDTGNIVALLTSLAYCGYRNIKNNFTMVPTSLSKWPSLFLLNLYYYRTFFFW